MPHTPRRTAGPPDRRSVSERTRRRRFTAFSAHFTHFGEVPVSLVANVHALQKILGDPSGSLEGVASALPPALRMSDALKETKLPLKVWLTSQLPLPPDLCALVLKAYKAALKAQLVAYLSDEAKSAEGASVVPAVSCRLPSRLCRLEPAHTVPQPKKGAELFRFVPTFFGFGPTFFGCWG